MLPVVMTETPLTTVEAAELLGTTARTVVRWLTTGCATRGRVVKLEGVRVGRHFRTSKEAVARFIAANQSSPPSPEIPTAGEVDRRHKAAVERAKRLGLKVR